MNVAGSAMAATVEQSAFLLFSRGFLSNPDDVLRVHVVHTGQEIA
jgi:hypothetical protein